MEVSKKLLELLEEWNLRKRWGTVELEFKNGVLTGMREHPRVKIDVDGMVIINIENQE